MKNILNNSIIDGLVVLAAIFSFGPLVRFMGAYPFFSICIAALLQLLALVSTTLLSPSPFESKYSISGCIRILAAGAFLWLLAPLTNPVLNVSEGFQVLFFLLIIFGGVLAVNTDLFMKPSTTIQQTIGRYSPILVGACILWAEALIMMYSAEALYPLAGIILFSALSYLPVRLYLALRTNERFISLIGVVLAFALLSFQLAV